jgi:RNA polymerase sigma factor (sigma-70 family)
MKVTGNGTGMELVGLSEEQLAEKAKQPEAQQAREALAQSLLPWVQRRLASLRRRSHGHAPEVNDLVQDTMLLLLQAARDYDATQRVPLRGYLARFLHLRFLELCRRWRRQEHLSQHSLSLNQFVNEVLPRVQDADWHGVDPVHLAWMDEAGARLRRFLAQISAQDRSLFELWEAGSHQPEAAEQLRMSLATLQRRWQQLRARVCVALGLPSEGSTRWLSW